jgi:hypothetical protein
MNTIKEICKYIGSAVGDGAVLVETGCSYVCHAGNEEHTTTNNLYEYVTKQHGIFYSLDIDPEHISFASEFVRPLLDGHADIHFIEGDSVASLEMLSKQWSGKGNGNGFDVLCLDSKDFDEDHMVNEFNAIKSSLNSEKHFVLVDDIHNPNSVKYKKMVPLLKELGYSWIEVPTPTGMFVAAKGYALP